ncbi:MAG TPA: glycosyltransferase family 2 protein [Burkholderiales bacterium]
MTLPVSVVIPCYRCAATLGRAVDSVLRQTQPPAEIIVVDDASDDGTPQVIARLPASVRRMRLETNGGPGTARNAGWNAARQDYVAFLDADDAWHPRKLELQHAWMQAHPGVVLSGHGYAFHENNNDLKIQKAFPVSTAMLLLSNRFSAQCVMLRRSLARRFADGKRHSEDYLLWLEVVLDGGSAWYLDAPLTTLFKPAYGAGGLSADLHAMEAGELDTLARLRRAGLLGPLCWAAASAWSCVKYLRRLALQALR